MKAKILVYALPALILATIHLAEAQQTGVYRIGVIFPGGAWYETIDGLKVGLRQLGLEVGKQLNLVMRETKGDATATEQVARNLEDDKVSLIYAAATSVAIAAKRGTSDISIVFAAGADPVALGLVDSFARSGGRLTGVFYRDSELTGKRLELLKEIVPKLRRIVTFYNPSSPVSAESAKFVRETAEPIGVQLSERHVSSADELQTGLRMLRAGEVDAVFEVSDALVQTHDQLVIDTAVVKKLPTMFIARNSVLKGGLANYSVSRHEVGRVSAKYVQRILTGVKPKDLPVEGVDKIALIINLKTAKQIGLTIPPNVLVRADQVIK